MPIPTYADLVRRFGLAFRPDLPAYAYGDHPRAHRDAPDREIHDAVVRAAFNHDGAFALGGDPYAAALAVWQQDGLLGAGDPGPPGFRAAHAAYLLLRADRVGPPQALILEHDASDLDKILTICAEAYQVVGALAHQAGVFDHPDVIRALDRLTDPLGSVDDELLPWPKTPLAERTRPRIPLQEMLDAVARFSSETHPLRINTRTQGTFAEMERVYGVHRDRLVAWFAERGVDVELEA